MPDQTALLAGPPVDVARVAVDVALPHLDRPFDYAVPAAMAERAVPGARVRVRFAGRLRDGFVLERTDHTDAGRTLAPLHAVLSDEPVLSPEVARLVRAVADHCAGTFSDVVRLAVPPRHAATEKAAPRERTPLPLDGWTPAGSPLGLYPWGSEWLEALARGDAPRAFWQVAPTASPTGDWAQGFADAAAATAASGRGSVLVVPDTHDLDRLEARCREVLGPDGFVRLTADLGPAARYRAFLAVSRGQVKVVIGTRAASFAPVHELGLVAIWDDGDDLHAEPRAPYPHARDVLALRAVPAGGATSRAAVLVASHARSAEVQSWLEEQWLLPVALASREQRRSSAAVKVAVDNERALERDPHAAAARLPHEVFTAVRAGLARGPVLVQVPRTGHQRGLVCQQCRSRASCVHCHGPLESKGPGRDAVVGCRWCGRLQTDWRCAECGAGQWRAVVVGASRTAHELGRAFPQTPVRSVTGGQERGVVPDQPGLVVATPGAEPRAEHGYAAAVLLDAPLLLARPDLRAAEEALRRWLNATAAVRPGEEGGSVVVVGPSTARSVQALVRLDPAGFAERELAERAETRLMPAWRMVTVEGGPAALEELRVAMALPTSRVGLGADPGGPEPVDAAPPEDPLTEVEVLGPVELEGTESPDEPALHRLVLRCPPRSGPALVRAVKQAVSVRSARKSEGALRVRVDPVAFG
ncbi:primosomal protein N' [Auraticoccus monumenti]|uniref:Probable replication restart protein PriA n=1 Tax=Auraticoccus monumenti TaxID=675864 RepID=A0A1G7BDC2_9ACTN|nr:primosomal protein N' [Auraticoccus monumenti]SDE25059.1 replication restart DNA helicase PriA [Auraticoccus monumenti]